MKWQRWIRPGLVATILVALVAVLGRSSSIGHDLAADVQARLAAEGQGWAQVGAFARDVTIRGTAPSPEAQQAVLRIAQDVRGVHAVSDRSDLMPLASPYVWTAVRAGLTVTVSGAVPSEGARTAVLAAARRALPRAEIIDEMTPARGGPKAFNVATTFAFSRLADLAQGTVVLTDSTLVVTGVAVDAAAFAAIKKALRDELPPTILLGPGEIQPQRADPFVWSANFDGSSVTVAGFVPNEVVHESLETAVKATLPGVPIEDRVTVASGEPPGFAEAAGFAVTVLDRLSRGGITLDGLRLDVAGAAKTVDDYEAALATLTGPLPEGMQVVSMAIEPAAVDAYGWSGKLADGRLILSGYVPDPQSRTEIVGIAESLFPGRAIDQRMRIAAGEPRMDWAGAIKFALGQLAKLSTGSVDLGDKSYSIVGTAVSSDAFVAVSNVNAQKLPASLELKRADVIAPPASPYRFVAERDGASVAVRGDVGSEVLRQDVLSTMARKFGKAKIESRLTFASGGPENYIDAVHVVLNVLSRLAGGKVEISDRAVSVSGYAFYAAAVDEIGGDLQSALPEGFTVASNAITTRQEEQSVAADRCRDLLQTALQTGRIAFDGAKADLAADSVGVLDRVSSVVARCPEVGVEIGAHSDSDGSAARNRDLTQSRAEAIADYLVDAGVKRERLTAVGYGETKPIADNSTTEGKAANRRIEFTITEATGG